MKYFLKIIFFISTFCYSQANKTEYALLKKWDPTFKIYIEKTKNNILENEIKIITDLNSQIKNAKDNYIKTRFQLILAEFYSNTNLKTAEEIAENTTNYITKHPEYHHLKIHYNLVKSIFLDENKKQYSILKINNDNLNYVKYFKEFEPTWNFENTTNVNIINSLILTGKYNEALLRLVKLEKTASKNDIEYYNFLLGSISTCYNKSGNYKMSIIYLKKAESILEKKENFKVLLSSIYMLHGVNSLKDKDTINSISYFNKSYSLAKKIRNNFQTIRSGQHLAKTYNLLNQINESEKILFEILPISKKAGYKIEELTINQVLAETYLKKNEISKGIEKINLVYNYILKNKSKSNTTIALSYKNQIDVLIIKSKLHEKEKNYTEAFKCEKEINTLKQKEYENNETEKLKETISKYETEKKDNQILILKQREHIHKLEIDKQKNQIILLTIGMLTLLILFSFLIIYHRKINVIEKLSLRSKLTRLQFNPHYINNAFASLQASLMEENIDEKIINYTTHISRFSRLLLESTFNEEWSLSEEKQIIENYLKTQQFRLENGFVFNLDSEFTIEEMKKIKLPSAITQTVLENAIEHGGFNKNGLGKIDIYFIKNNDYINIIIKNNIVGESTNTIKKTNNEPSRGLEITKQRIKLHSKMYKKTTNFTFYQSQIEATILFELPIIINI